MARPFYQSDPGTGLYMVASGLVKMLVTSEDCEEMVLVTLGAGEALGELSIIDGGPRLACVVLPGRSGRLEALSIPPRPWIGTTVGLTNVELWLQSD